MSDRAIRRFETSFVFPMTFFSEGEEIPESSFCCFARILFGGEYLKVVAKKAPNNPEPIDPSVCCTSGLTQDQLQVMASILLLQARERIQQIGEVCLRVIEIAISKAITTWQSKSVESLEQQLRDSQKACEALRKRRDEAQKKLCETEVSCREERERHQDLVKKHNELVGEIQRLCHLYEQVSLPPLRVWTD